MTKNSKEKVEKSLKHLKEQHNKLYEAYQDFGKAIHTEGPIDEKTRLLIKVSLAASNNTPNTLRIQISKAIEFGCTLKEVEHAIWLTATNIGFPAMMESYIIFREIVDETDPMNELILDNIISH